MPNEYESKLAQGLTVLQKHNDALTGDEEDLKVDVIAFRKEVRRNGGTDLDGLAHLSWEDLIRCGAPRAVAVQIAKLWRAKDQDQPEAKAGGASDEDKVISRKRAEKMQTHQLLKHYDPKKPRDAVANELATRSGGYPCIVLLPDGAVDIPLSDELFTEIQNGNPWKPGEPYVVPGQDPRRVYRIGETVEEELLDECPLHHGERLAKRGGVSDICPVANQPWTGVPIEVRQLLRLAVDSGEVRVTLADDAIAVMERAKQPGADKALRTRYPRAAVKFGDLSRLEQLPRLKVPKGGTHRFPFGDDGRDPHATRSVEDDSPRPAPTSGGASSMPRKLSGAKLAEFQNAILSAFPSRDDLARLFFSFTGKRLDHQVKTDGNLVDTVFNLLMWSESHGKHAELLAAARAANPGNPALAAFAADRGNATTRRDIVFITSSKKVDRDLEEAIRLQLQGPFRGRHWSERDIRGGSRIEDEWNESFAHAKVILLIVSADLFADPSAERGDLVSRALDESVRRGVKLIPVRFRPTLMPTALEGKVGYPRNGGWISLSSNREQIVCDIARSLAVDAPQLGL